MAEREKKRSGQCGGAPATTARADRHRRPRKRRDRCVAQRAYLPIGFANIMCDMPPSHAIDCAVI